MTEKRALGRGLATLIPVGEEGVGQGSVPEITPVDILRIVPSRRQPRTEFSVESIRELAQSIREEGVLQPILVSPLLDGRFELIAGERRWRAAKEIGLEKIPAQILTVDEGKKLQLAIIENVQREDLNPIDEARAYQALATEFGLSQMEIAQRVGRSREVVANSLRLLKLPQVVQEDVTKEKISAGHARAILAASTVEEQLHLRERILEGMLTVRDVERMIQERGAPRRKPGKKDLPRGIKWVIDGLSQVLATKISMKSSGDYSKGQIVIDYYSPQDLDRIYYRVVGEKGQGG